MESMDTSPRIVSAPCSGVRPESGWHSGPRVLELLQDKDIQENAPSCQLWGAVQGGQFWQQLQRKPYEAVGQRLTGMVLYCFEVGEDGDVIGELPQAALSNQQLANVKLIPVLATMTAAGAFIMSVHWRHC